MPFADTASGRAKLPFQPVRRLGSGGTASVFEVKRPGDPRRLAAKLLRAESRRARERFRREGQVVARLRHPGIVSVHEAGELPDGTPFLLFDLIDGRSLDKVAEQEGPLAPERALNLTRQVADALAYAHERKIVHRDVKPENILITADDTALLTDFGIALVEDLGRLTRTGAFTGTPLYMAKEQLTGEGKIGPWTDVHALGAVLFELLTGTTWVPLDQPHMLMDKVVRHVPPSVRKLRPEVDESVAKIVARCLEKDHEQRYQDGAALRDALDRAMRPRDDARKRPPAPPPPALGRVGLPLVGVLILVVVACIGWAVAERTGKSELQREVTKAQESARQVTQEANRQVLAAEAQRDRVGDAAGSVDGLIRERDQALAELESVGSDLDKLQEQHRDLFEAYEQSEARRREFDDSVAGIERRLAGLEERVGDEETRSALLQQGLTLHHEAMERGVERALGGDLSAFDRAMTLVHLGRNRQALIAVQEARRAGDREPDWQVVEFFAYDALGDERKASQVLNQLAGDGAPTLPHQIWAHLKLDLRMDAGPRMAMLRNAVENGQRAYLKVDLADVLIEQGTSSDHLSELDEALVLLAEVLEQTPLDPRAWNLRSQARYYLWLFRDRDTTSGVENGQILVDIVSGYRIARELSPRPEYWLSTGKTLVLMRMDRWAGLELDEAAIRFQERGDSEGQASALVWLGILAKHGGDEAAAATYWVEAIQVAPRSAEAYEFSIYLSEISEPQRRRVLEAADPAFRQVLEEVIERDLREARGE
jgi:tetratricopeptide (TPR) repeat protein